MKSTARRLASIMLGIMLLCIIVISGIAILIAPEKMR